jgi:hypothetical protein
MLVKFSEKELNAIVDWDRLHNIPKDELLSQAKIYTVYGIHIRNNIVAYQILYDVETYTMSFPSHLFEIVDNRLSRYFCFGKSITGDHDEITFISFKEWVENKLFYYKLVEGEPREVMLFEHYKALMELEFRNPQVETVALLKEGAVLECPECENIWEEQMPDFEMCKCNKCRTILLNPISGASHVNGASVTF